MTVTKSHIVDRVYGKIGFSKKEAADVVESVFELIKESLEQGEKVKISGFGSFVLHDKGERTGRNPQTGEAITIRSRRVLGFKASPILKGRINGED